MRKLIAFAASLIEQILDGEKVTKLSGRSLSRNPKKRQLPTKDSSLIMYRDHKGDETLWVFPEDTVSTIVLNKLIALGQLEDESSRGMTTTTVQ
jgi:hypothetical protein